MMKGPFRELIPVEAGVQILIPKDVKVKQVRLLMADTNAKFETKKDSIVLKVPRITDHEIIALDLLSI